MEGLLSTGPTPSSLLRRPLRKSCIVETLELLACAESSTDTKTEERKKYIIMCHASGVICHTTGVRCQVSHVMCHLSPVTCHLSLMPKDTATDPTKKDRNRQKGTGEGGQAWDG